MGEQATAQQTAENVLTGLGMPGTDHVERGDVARHVRRPLTDDEISALPRTRATGP